MNIINVYIFSKAKSGIINDEDSRSVEKMLIAQIISLKKAREDRKLLVEHSKFIT